MNKIYIIDISFVGLGLLSTLRALLSGFGIAKNRKFPVYDITRKITRIAVRPPQNRGFGGGYDLDFRQFSSNDIEKKI